MNLAYICLKEKNIVLVLIINVIHLWGSPTEINCGGYFVETSFGFQFSSLIYLFIFHHHLQASIKPKCGRLVGFSSGGENPHGVKAVTGGQRCAVALWFTLDPLYRELVRILKYNSVINLISFLRTVA